MSEAPPFWFEKAGVFAWLLSPFSALYGYGAAYRMGQASRVVADVPVLCVGNFIAGGAGKTPTAIAIAHIARGQNLKVGFLSRGYGAYIAAAMLVDGEKHNAHDVGDEPLILSQFGPTVVSPDRPRGATLLAEQGVDLIIMDDGFQNPSLHKDYSLAVVDARRGIGNGFCMPAGPMRAPLRAQLKAASAILLIGRSDVGTQIVRKAAKMAKPLLTAEIVARNGAALKGKQVLAFAGIADPQKFYTTLRETGAEIVERRAFGDHHPFADDECQELLSQAQSKNLTLVTTEKDAMRLMRMGEAQKQLWQACEILTIDLQFENPKMVEMILQKTIRNAQENKV